MKKQRTFRTGLLRNTAVVFISFGMIGYAGITSSEEGSADKYNPYISYLEEVYKAMRDEYFAPVSNEKFAKFIKTYKSGILDKLESDKFIPYYAWRGAHLLVQNLRDPRDKFSSFVPPKPAEEYKKEIYGERVDIGVSGELTPRGYSVDAVEKRSDAFAEGIRPGFIIVEIDGEDVTKYTAEEVTRLLTPEIGTILKLKVFIPEENKYIELEVESHEYFKETVTEIPTGAAGIFCLKIHKFNRETHNDLGEYVDRFVMQGMKYLILDVRDNPGGPPLSVREISGFFMPGGMRLCYYKKKGKPAFSLFSPESDINYGGTIIVLVNKGSGSASELLAGTLKEYNRAYVAGRERTAGSAFLKGVHNFDDGSMLAMVTGLSYLHDGKELGLKGVTPNLVIPLETEDPVKFIVKQLQR